MIELRNVSYSYIGKNVRVDAVKSISCHFEEGKFYALMGPSGSGKSTLMQLINALVQPTQGSILYQGKPIETFRPNEYRLKYVSLIHQNFCLLPFLNVLENVLYPTSLLKINKQEARIQAIKQLETLGLDATYHKRMPSMLSGGEQQRVAIARAMCTGAPVLTADEPTGNLDSENARHIASIFSRLAREEKKTIIMVTHDPEMAKQADIVLHLKDGKLISSPSDI